VISKGRPILAASYHRQFDARLSVREGFEQVKRSVERHALCALAH
jgi:hypothetical protein